ncbi:protein trichome birefringence-like 14 [Euphorbia lathyris]|uniref:protein trichome birefringence-like 14 n=1 Tax=Euphorbia lathyris TaxID=212925 RepID=UPI003313F691
MIGMNKMASAKYTRIDARRQPTNYCSTLRIVVFVVLCLVGIWMMSSLFVVPGQIVEVSQENKNEVKEEKQEETHETIKKSATDETETEKKTETDEIGTKLDESSSGTKDENTDNGINLDVPANNQSSEKMGSSKESSGDLPMNVTPSLASETEASHGDSVSSPTAKACNYAKGRWVEDNRRPLYSGAGCKQWLSEMWACRLTQRTDFSYERYRWQPDDCEMTEFKDSEFLRRMQDKTIAFIGDSLGRQQFQSLMCMATGGEWRLDVEDVGVEYGLVKARGAVRPDGWAYRFTNTNTTILYYWSASLADLEPLNVSDPTTDVAMHLDRAPAFMRQFLDRFDVLILNTGHHWNRGKLRANRWVMYANGKPIKDKKLLDIGNAKNFTVHSIAKWLDSQLPSHPRLVAFFRTISPRHFRFGDWNTGGNCDNTTPLTGGSEVSRNDSMDEVVGDAVKGTKIKLLDVTAVSDLRDEGHISRYSVKAKEGVNDCLHWCLPGIPDTWNELVAAQV